MSSGRPMVLGLAVAAGPLALALVEPVVWPVVPIGLLGPLARGRAAGWPWPVLGAVVAAVLAGAWLSGTLPFEAALGLGLGWVAVRHVLGRAGAHDDRVALLASTLLLVLAATRTTSASFLLPLGVWATAGPAALVLGTVERARTAPPLGRGLVPSVLVLSLLVFFTVPRLGAVASPEAATLTDFRPEVELGDLATLLDDPAPVVRVTGIEGPVWLRGAVFDHFDGRRWSTRAPRHAPTSAEGPRVRVEEIEVVEQVLLTVPGTAAVEVDVPELLTDADGNWWVRRPARPLAYTLVLDDAPVQASASDLARWTEPPDPRLADLAARIAGEARAPLEVAEAIRTHLAARHPYTRAPRDAALEEPLIAFLLEERAGHCEYFASAMVLLLRARGVPARLVNGFAGGEWNEFGGYWLFRRSHAHAWVEVLADGRWVTVDATPGPAAPVTPAPVRLADALESLWERSVVRYDLGVQKGLVVGWGQRLDGWVGGGSGWPWRGLLAQGVLVLLIGLASVRAGRSGLRRLAGEVAPSPPVGRVAQAHARAWRTLRSRGWTPPPALPPVAAARWVRERAGAAAEPLERLAWLHYEVRWGGADDAANAAEAHALALWTEDLPAPE